MNIRQIAKSLLESKNFKVIGSVRDSAKASSLVSSLNNNPDFEIDGIENIAEPNAFDESFKKYGKSIDFILHTASPFTFNISDVQKDLIDPAKNGSENIFKAAHLYATNLKHFVVTSSFAAIVDRKIAGDPSTIFNEKSWNPNTLEDGLKSPASGYTYSKTVAEQTIWSLAEKLNVEFGVTAVNTLLVLGPQAFDSNATKTLNTSCEFVRKLIQTKFGEDIPDGLTGAAVDVRDVAKAYIMPLLDSQKFDKKRLFMTESPFSNQIILDSLNKVSGLQGQIAAGTPHKDDNLGNTFAKQDNTKTKKLLGFEFTPVEKSVMDTAVQILKVQKEL
ncbi:hypothetical protein QEN19_002297 [Hanseniaspora menglaensis]